MLSSSWKYLLPLESPAQLLSPVHPARCPLRGQHVRAERCPDAPSGARGGVQKGCLRRRVQVSTTVPSQNPAFHVRKPSQIYPSWLRPSKHRSVTVSRPLPALRTLAWSSCYSSHPLILWSSTTENAPLSGFPPLLCFDL